MAVNSLSGVNNKVFASFLVQFVFVAVVIFLVVPAIWVPQSVLTVILVLIWSLSIMAVMAWFQLDWLKGDITAWNLAMAIMLNWIGDLIGMLIIWAFLAIIL